MKHINVSVFVPHAGCPHQCSFCNQRSISGAASQPTAQDVRDAALVAMRSSPEGIKDGEIAFFGGSFTAIDRDYMTELLSAAQEFIGENGFRGIRISTRPDAVDGEICDILERYSVTAVELGAQSTDDRVLAMNRRGHTREDIFRSARLLKERSFETGLQMMTGLYGSTDEDCMNTARDIISLAPDTVRIYPTVVIEHTELAELFRRGEYRPQTPEEAAVLCAQLLPMFESAGIRVIRLGLHSGGDVEGSFVAGAYHPALREMCEGHIYFDIISKALAGRERGRYIIYVAPREVSKAAGQRRCNLEKLKELGYECRIKESARLTARDIDLEKVNLL